MVLNKLAAAFAATVDPIDALEIAEASLSVKIGMATQQLKLQVAAWLATPFGQIATLVALTAGAFIALNAVVEATSFEHAAETAEGAVSAAEESTAALQEVQTQLDGVREKIDAINNGDTVSDLTDPSELKELEREAVILERQLAAKKALAAEENKAARDAVVAALGAYDEKESGITTETYGNYGDASVSETLSVAAAVDIYKQSLSDANAIIDKYTDANGHLIEMTEAEQAGFDAATKKRGEATLALQKYQSGITNLLTEYLKIDGAELTDAEIAPYVALSDAIAEVLGAFGGSTGEGDVGDVEDFGDAVSETTEEVKTLIEALDDLYGSLSGVKDAFEDFADDGKLTYDTLSDIADKFADVDGIDDYINRLSDASV